VRDSALSQGGGNICLPQRDQPLTSLHVQLPRVGWLDAGIDFVGKGKGTRRGFELRSQMPLAQLREQDVQMTEATSFVYSDEAALSHMRSGGRTCSKIGFKRELSRLHGCRKLKARK
jgi:hypothetical protein